MGEQVPIENGSKPQITLDTEVANGIKHAVATLDESSAGKVAKSQLQAVVANVCQAIKTPFVSDDLDCYLPDDTELSVSEFLEFLETKLLVKGKKLNVKEINELSWVLVGQKYEDDPHMLTKKDAYKLWLVFKKVDVSGELRVDVEELCIILEKFIRGMGVQWNQQFLDDFAEDGALTFWKFIDCLERKFLIGVEKNVLREGLQELYDFILDEVTRTGFLTKKGHNMIKSQKTRWYALKPDRLTYYVSSGFREKKGEIILNADAKVTSIPDKGSNKCRFLVTCGSSKKDYEQTAPDQRTKQAWMADIQTAIDCFGGETPLKRDLIARKAKRDEVRARKGEEERKKKEQEDLLDQQRKEIDLLKKRKEEIEKLADEEKAMLDAEIKRREELEEIQRNLQQLLEDQKRAREEDERIRAAKERLLEEERVKREQLEALRLQQQQELQNEKMQKEELMEKQKEQERILEEERKRLQHLEEERMKAEEAAKAAKDKLTAAEAAAKNAAEEAKDKVRQLKTSVGLKGTVGPKVDPLVSHRGKGAFTLEEFLNRATEWSGLALDDRPKLTAPEVDDLVKASATPASNQNVPEFLKKAAAWSGLNPETYLEEEEKKGLPPPKVAAKPPKPLPNAAKSSEAEKVAKDAVPEGEQASQEGEQVAQECEQALPEGEQASPDGDQVAQEAEQVSQEDNQVLKEDAQLSKEGEQVSEESGQVSEESGSGPQVEEKEVEGSDRLQVVDDASEGATVSNDEAEVKDEKVAEGSELLPVDHVGSQEVVVDGGGSEEVVVNDVKSESGVEGEDTQMLEGGSGKCNDAEERKNEAEVAVEKGKDNESLPEATGEGDNSGASEEKSPDVGKDVVEKKSEVEEVKKESDVAVDGSNSGEAGDDNCEAGDNKAKQEESDVDEAKQSQLDTCSELNNEESGINNGKSEVNEDNVEVKNGQLEADSNENEPTETNNNQMDEEAGQEGKQETDSENIKSEEVSGEKDNVVENGQCSDETQNANEPPSDGESQPELSEKCAKLNENTENVEVVST